MQTPYIINCQKYLPEGGSECADFYIEDSGVSSVKDTVLKAVRSYNVVPLSFAEVCNWFGSSYHVEDREYFEHGIERYYTLHFPLLTGRALERVNQMLAIACKEKPACLK